MIRTRFAPSPTGFLHVGGLRTALYSFLYAHKHGGKFLLRIEDTDQTREVAGAVESLVSTLKRVSLSFDEGPEIGGPYGPYIQSQRTAIYRKHAEELLLKGAAYRCFCSKERLTEMRAYQEAHRMPPMYDRTCLKLSSQEIQNRIDAGVPFVIRQKILNSEETFARFGERVVRFADLVRGDVSFDPATIDDQVLMKSDGFPTYHLANVVDDHLMKITHVIRGEEWLSSTPKHILLYASFGWEAPNFAHLPLLLNKDKTKLSKRQGDVAVEDYLKKGYLPEALLNFIALLGWHPGKGITQEIFSLEELTQQFDLGKVHTSGAIFDLEKLDWIQWQWNRRKFETDSRSEAEKIIELASPYLPEEWKTDYAFLSRCLATVKEKLLQKPREIREQIHFYFDDESEFDWNVMLNEKMKVDVGVASRALKAAHETLSEFEDFDSQEAIKACLISVVEYLGCKNGQVFWPVRAALTGEQFSPGVFEVIWALGKERTLKRLDQALMSLKI